MPNKLRQILMKPKHRRNPVSHEDRRMPDPWRDDVDSHLRFLRAEAKQSSKDRQLFRTELDTHTKMLTGISTQLDDLAPVITGVKAAKKGGRWASWVANWGAKIAKVGVFTGAMLAFALAITHGETWSAAAKAFWRVVTRSIE